MYLHKFIIFLSVILLIACQKNNSLVAQQSSAPDFVPGDQMSMFDLAYQQDYKEDFVMSSNEDGVHRELVPGDELWKLIQTAGNRDKTALAQTFPQSKSKIEELYQNDAIGEHIPTIQYVSLSYLRRFLLEQEKVEKNQRDVRDLLSMLVSTKAVDLDVLVDAYAFSEAIFSEEEKGDFFNHIALVYSYDMKYIKDNAEAFIKKINESTGPEQRKYMLWAKNLERSSFACAHARRVLPQLDANNN